MGGISGSRGGRGDQAAGRGYKRHLYEDKYQENEDDNEVAILSEKKEFQSDSDSSSEEGSDCHNDVADTEGGDDVDGEDGDGADAENDGEDGGDNNENSTDEDNSDVVRSSQSSRGDCVVS